MKNEEEEKAITEFTTVEILANWTRLAKFIQHHEPLNWEDAKTKALALNKDKDKAAIYVIRKKTPELGQVAPIPAHDPIADPSIDPMPELEQVEKPQAEVAPIAKAASKPKKKKQNIYKQNYKRLLKIAKGLEDRLIQGLSVNGISKVPGLNDFRVSLIEKQNEGLYHLELSQANTQNGEPLPYPVMRVVVDIPKQELKALSYKDAGGCKEVYQDCYKRVNVNLQRRSEQNQFLKNWLSNLASQKHSLKWSDMPPLAPNTPQEVGKVKLTSFHIYHGVQQKHIDWINKHLRGLILVVKREVLYAGGSFVEQLKDKGLPMGFRISRSGVIYCKGKSDCDLSYN